jgi:septum formation topological specificity factor MinE
VTRTLQVDQPLAARDPRYVDLSAVRGDDPRGRLRRRLLKKQPGEHLHMVFASHRGAGKTTELNRLREEVSSRFHVVMFESNLELNPHAIEIEDLLLVICRFVAEEMDRIGVPIEREHLDAVSSWFASITRTTAAGSQYVQEVESQAKAGADFPLLATLFSRYLALFRTSTEEREEVKQVLRRYPGALLDATNRLLEAAHRRLRTELNRELLIIVDNMDRYPAENMSALLDRNGDTLTRLRCSLVVTPPLLLVYRPASGGGLDHFEVQVMPAFRTRTDTMPYDALLPEARAKLEEVLARRIDLERVLPDSVARDRLYVASGGAVRELIELVGEASLEVDEAPIPIDAVEKVVKRRRGRMRAQINANGWAGVLGRIGRSKTLHEDPRCLDLLYLRFAFEYNGTIWHDLHPLVAEIDEVKAAMAVPRPA